MWQKCPICEGKGFIEDTNYNSGKCTLTSTCPTCEGHRIISKISGLPPESNNNKSAVESVNEQLEKDKEDALRWWINEMRSRK